MNLTDSRLAQGGSEKLDLAILSFFEQFRKIYVGDQVQKTSKVSTAHFSNTVTLKHINRVFFPGTLFSSPPSVDIFSQ